MHLEGHIQIALSNPADAGGQSLHGPSDRSAKQIAGQRGGDRRAENRQQHALGDFP